MASLDCDEAHFRATLATLDTQLYSIAPREHIATPASKLKTDRLTVRQPQVGEMYMPVNVTQRVAEMDMAVKRTMEVGEMDMRVRRTMEIGEMDRVAPKRAMEIGEMDMRVKRAMEVAEMDMASHPTKASAMDVSPQFAVVQGVLDRLQ